MTVSAALSGKPGVSEETRRRIQEIAQKLNYTPNILATSFRNDKTNTVGVIISSSFDAVFTIIFRGIESVAKEQGVGLLVATTEDNHDAEMAAIRMLAAKRGDGIILTSALVLEERQKQLLDATGIPYVLSVRSYQDASVTTVRNNNYDGGYSMVEYLLKTGSKRFAFLAMGLQRCSSYDRVRGWEDALRNAGMAMENHMLDYIDPFIDIGYEAMRSLIARGELSFDTLVCGNDHIAIGAMKAMGEAGIAIPDQVRLAGYDGFPLTEYLRIPLTTIQQPLHEIGQIAMRLLYMKMTDPGTSPQQIVIGSKLVIRCST